MGVGVQGEARAVVAQHAGQRFHVHAAGDRHRGKCVSEVVETYMLLDACVFQQLPVDSRHGRPDSSNRLSWATGTGWDCPDAAHAPG